MYARDRTTRKYLFPICNHWKNTLKNVWNCFFPPTTIIKFIILMSLIHLEVLRAMEQDVLPSSFCPNRNSYLPISSPFLGESPLWAIHPNKPLNVFSYFFDIWIAYCIKLKFLALWLCILHLDTNSSLKSLHGLAKMEGLSPKHNCHFKKCF